MKTMTSLFSIHPTPNLTANLTRHLIAAITISTFISLAIVSPTPASAAPTDDGCFAFTTATGTITNYYDHIDNDSSNDVRLPI